MEDISINSVRFDNIVLETLKEYQDCGVEMDCQVLNRTIDYLFRISHESGYAGDMDSEGMLRLLYSLRMMMETLKKLIPENHTELKH